MTILASSPRTMRQQSIVGQFLYRSSRQRSSGSDAVTFATERTIKVAANSDRSIALSVRLLSTQSSRPLTATTLHRTDRLKGFCLHSKRNYSASSLDAATGSTIATLIRSSLNSIVTCKRELRAQTQRYGYNYYSTSRVCNKSTDDDDEKNRIYIPGQPEISTINCDDLTEEQILAIVEEEERKLDEEERAKVVPNWKPGMRKRPLVTSFHLEDFEYELEPEKHLVPRWNKNLDQRSGALAIKVGMMPVFDNWGIRHPCTVLYMDRNVVLGHKTLERDGYLAVCLAAGERKRKNVGKCVLGQYKGLLEHDVHDDANAKEETTSSDSSNAKKNPPYLVREFRVSDASHLIPLYTQVHARHFVPGQALDVSGITKGKGFQGGMKRHGFGGMPASHGVSRAHRALGSVGSCQDPGRVFKGKKMEGHMGVDRRTVQNLRLVKVDRGRNLLYVMGAVPGNKGEFVEVKDAVKRPLWKTQKVLDQVDRPPVPTFDYDASIDGCGLAGHEVFMPLPERDPLLPDTQDEAA